MIEKFIGANLSRINIIYTPKGRPKDLNLSTYSKKNTNCSKYQILEPKINIHILAMLFYKRDK
jgi:hypothetical protein